MYTIYVCCGQNDRHLLDFRLRSGRYKIYVCISTRKTVYYHYYFILRRFVVENKLFVWFIGQ